MRPFSAVLLALSIVGPTLAEDVAEPRSGTKFAVKDGDTLLLGVDLRTKTIAKVKVYAIGFYGADTAISGPLNRIGRTVPRAGGRRLQEEGGHEVPAQREHRSDPRCLPGLLEGGRRQGGGVD